MPEKNEVHLVVLIHGLWGSPAHLFAAKEELEHAWAKKTGQREKETSVKGPEEDPTISTTIKSQAGDGTGSEGSDGRDGEEGRTAAGDYHGEELVVVIAGGMTSQLTYDGVDVCASRVAWEIDQEIAKLEAVGKSVTRFSVTGYSLGGLVARYLVGLLHSRSPSFFEKHKPITFSTVATPHLGVPKYNTLLSGVLVWLGSKLLSRSGEQLYVADKYSDDDPRPLLEIMADPNLTFVHALEQFKLIQIFANGQVVLPSSLRPLRSFRLTSPVPEASWTRLTRRVNDHTVPYPSSAIETMDHFAEWADRGLRVESDEDDLITSWSAPPADDLDVQMKMKKKGWGISMGTLPPVLRYRFPFNYIILLLFPIMLPLVILLMVSRLAFDTTRSKRRLQRLAQTATSPTQADRANASSTSSTTSSSPNTPIPNASGLSIQSLRDAIRKVERELESDLIDALDSPDLPSRQQSTRTAPASRSKQGHGQSGPSHSPEHGSVPMKTKVLWKDSQLRMALWLNQLPLAKHVSWYPDTNNAHSVSIVRDPKAFPAHNQGRGLLRRWAEGVVNA